MERYDSSQLSRSQQPWVLHPPMLHHNLEQMLLWPLGCTRSEDAASLDVQLFLNTKVILINICISSFSWKRKPKDLTRVPKNSKWLGLSRGGEDTINQHPLRPLPFLTELYWFRYTNAHSLCDSRKSDSLTFQIFLLASHVFLQELVTKYELM